MAIRRRRKGESGQPNGVFRGKTNWPWGLGGGEGEEERGKGLKVCFRGSRPCGKGADEVRKVGGCGGEEGKQGGPACKKKG